MTDAAPTQAQILQAALVYAEQGWPVFPLAHVWVVDGWRHVCACGMGTSCLSPGKHPKTRQGLFDATTDVRVIEGWAKRWPNFNLAVRTGVAFDAVDIDGDEGRASLAELVGDEEFEGLIQETGRGHHLLVKPTGYTNRAHVRPGIDFRGVGGYIVVDPSLHINGTRYRWRAKAPIIEAPEWLQILLAPDPNRCRHIMPSGNECGRSSPHGHRGGIVYPTQGLGL